jgi:phenylacetic acid degradation operon negative regulatory protein
MPDPVAAATAALLRRFGRQRPLRGGSLLITVFGDAIAPRGGAVTLASIIALARPFGLNERLVRTAMTRLADDGWLQGRRLGRLSEYRLSPEGAERFAAATRQIYGVPEQPWAGLWSLVLVPAVERRVREAAREALGWAGFGEPVPGVFAHPVLPQAEVEALLRGSPSLAGALVLTGTGAAPGVQRRLATLGWDLSDLAGRYRRFVAQFKPVLAGLRSRPAPAALPAFTLRTLLIHEYRKVHLRDPLLPAELLPDAWVGADAYRLCRALYERVARASEVHLSAVGRRLDGPLPPADAALATRFGGLEFR